MRTLTEQDIVTFLEFAAPTYAKENAVRFANNVLQKFGIADADVREKERVAFWEGAMWFENFSRKEAGSAAPRTKSAVELLAAKRDERYPSLIPPPKTVTLSNGEKYELNDNPAFALFRNARTKQPVYTAPCATIEDFKKCSDLLMGTG